MSHYFQYETSDNYNKIYGNGPFPSGAGAMPYTFGWKNKYSPRPFGVRLVSEQFSRIANPSISPQEGHTLATYGPINGIYEVQVSGITDKSGFGCATCSGLNRTYLVYHNSDSDGSLVGDHPSDADDNVSWFGRACNVTRPIHLCNIDGIYLNLAVKTTDVFTGANIGVASSGYVFLIAAMRNATLQLLSPDDGVEDGGPTYYFVKRFGNINLTDPLQNARKPQMMDGEHILLPSGNTSHQTVNNYTLSNTGFIPSVIPGTSSSGDYHCNIDNATVIIRPYKRSMFDIKQSSYLFYSGDAFPLYGNEDTISNTDTWSEYGQNGGDRAQWEASQNQFLNVCNNYYYNNSANYRNLIGNSGDGAELFNVGAANTPNSVYKFTPYLFSLRISGVVDGSGRITSCVPCSDFYNSSKNLIVDSYTTGIDRRSDGNSGFNGANPGSVTRYAWFAGSRNPNDNLQINYDYYNICNNACGNSVRSATPLPTGINGPCNNYLELVLINSGIVPFAQDNMKSKLTAMIHFVSSNANGFKYHKKRFKKVICDDFTSPACTISGVVGVNNCFSPSFWSGTWTLEDMNLNEGFFGATLVNSGLDVFNYCDFSSANPILTPQSNPTTPCAAQLCTICDGHSVPRTVTATFSTTSWWNVCSSGAWGTDTVVMQLDGIGTTYPRGYLNKRGCSWSYDDGTTSATCVWDGVGSGGMNFFLLGYSTVTSNITASMGGWMSGASTGGVVDFRINCANGLYDGNRFEAHTCSGNVTATITDVEFGDLYDIRNAI